MSDPLLEIRNLNLRVANTPLLNDLNLNVHAGAFHVILGPSGCGKTTLLKCICGFHEDWDGDIVLKEKSSFTRPQGRVGMVFQNYALFAHMSVEENIAFGLSGLCENKKRERIAWLLALSDLEHVRKKRPPALSGGEQQRAALARSLAPVGLRLLLLDEPFANLDPTLAKRMRGQIRTILKKAGVACLMVTHDTEEAMFMADVLSVMDERTIKQTDTPVAIRKRPLNQRIARFLGDPNIIAAQAKKHSAQSVLGRLILEREQEGKVDVLIWPSQIKFASSGKIKAKILERFFIEELTKYLVEVDAITLKIVILADPYQAFPIGAQRAIKIDENLHSWHIGP